MSENIVFIGGGNMTTSLVGGILKARTVDAKDIVVGEPSAAGRDRLVRRFGVRATSDNAVAVQSAAAVVLAVKPQVMRAAVQSFAHALGGRRPLFVSVAAGVREPDIRAMLYPTAAIVRSMPNTPALLGCGAIGLFANEFVGSEQRSLAETVLGAAGITEWVARESLLDAITALSGSGPAYFFALMEWLAQIATEMGLEPDTASRFAIQTALGAARMAAEGDDDPGQLREKVTSPNGTTEAALKSLTAQDAKEVFATALAAARDRAVELGDEFGTEK